MCDLGQLELTVTTGHFGLLYRQVYGKVSKQASKQASMQVSGHGRNQALATYKGCPKKTPDSDFR